MYFRYFAIISLGTDVVLHLKVELMLTLRQVWLKIGPDVVEKILYLNVVNLFLLFRYYFPLEKYLNKIKLKIIPCPPKFNPLKLLKTLKTDRRTTGFPIPTEVRCKIISVSVVFSSFDSRVDSFSFPRVLITTQTAT